MTDVSVNTQLAHAARRVRALADRLPEEHRPDVAAEWSALLDAVDGLPDSQARRRIAGWMEEMETRLSATLAHAPLEASRLRPSRVAGGEEQRTAPLGRASGPSLSTPAAWPGGASADDPEIE